MSGYRHSSFDPDAYQELGPPLRPYNWLQWCGVALGSVGVLLSTLHLFGRLGWIPQWVDDSSPGAFILLIIGVVLINSRRGPRSLVGSEQRAKDKRTLIITLAAGAMILGVAAVIGF